MRLKAFAEAIKKRHVLTAAFLLFLVIIIAFAWSFLSFLNQAPDTTSDVFEQDESNKTAIGVYPDVAGKDTTPTREGKVSISGNTFSFDPKNVVTVRPDLFDSGFFSMFDVLVHLDSQGLINLEYHFDEAMNTHVIDSINDEANWWYETYYSGGWQEKNVFRPDHYPWKDGTTLTFYKTTPSNLEQIYSVWKEEVTRKRNNNGAVVIPKVTLQGRTFTKEFENVTVTPHNIRSDVLRENVTTALDVILSLGDQGKITYELQWYESIGTASIVKDYWVEAIDSDKAYGRCGFVYEAGAYDFRFFQGNHIHLPSDTRILNSPEYVEWFWICI